MECKFMNIIPKNTLQFWFTRIGSSSNFNVIDIQNGTKCCTLSEGEMKMDHKIFQNFEIYKNRPEYQLGKVMHFLESSDENVRSNAQKIVQQYDTLIAACILESNYDEDIAVKQINNCLEWLHSTDFYDAPASTKYHEKFQGGLMLHSLRVVNMVYDIIRTNVFKGIPLYQAVLTALVHDWCKIGLYKPYQRNVKDPNTGNWYQEIAYQYNEMEIPLGHGATSLFLAQRFFTLTVEQACAIRWHMEAYNVCESEKPDLYTANTKYRMVQLIQMCDKLSLL